MDALLIVVSLITVVAIALLPIMHWEMMRKAPCGDPARLEYEMIENLKK